ncbi:MAG: Holliday junction resolvase RuvX [Candidatus Gracilibacteria bacterium]|nr:Holliday junction resolvase RuvX [Candidatus Gracilibacteria bacterium]
MTKKYLGIDLGNKKVGIAVEQNKIAMPYKIIERVKIIGELKKLVKERNITDIVVGLPFDLYGKDNTRLDKANKFIKKLSDIFPDINIHGEDERFSSFEADLSLNQIGKKDKEKIDDISASLILGSFLEKN